MSERLTIGQVAERSGLPIKTIHFYEEQGIVPAPERSPGGFRLYTPLGVRRLRLVRLVKLMGLSLPEIKTLVSQAFASECADFADELLARIASQQTVIDARIAELTTLKGDLTALAQHAEHSREQLKVGQRVGGCDFCPILDAGLPADEAS